MKTAAIIAACLALAACEMTPTQKRWTAVGVGIVATGLVLSHQQRDGKPVADMGPAPGNGKGGFIPCSGPARDCK